MVWVGLLVGLLSLAAGSVDSSNPSASHALVRFDPPHCASCAALDLIWEQLEGEYPGLLSRIDCVADPETCARGGVHAPLADATTQPAHPILKWRSYDGWRRYKGAHTHESLRAYVERKLVAASRSGGPPQPSHQRSAPIRLANAIRHRSLASLLIGLAACAACIWLLRWWLRYLQSPAEEAAGSLLAVASATSTDAAADSSLYIFRVHPEKGSLSLISWVRMHTEVAYLAAEPAPASVCESSGHRPCYVIHAAATERARGAARARDARARDARAGTGGGLTPSRGASRGAVLSLKFDPRQGPAIEMLGFVELPSSECTGLTLAPRNLCGLPGGGVAAIASTADGKLFALSHAFGKPRDGLLRSLLCRWRRRRRTGALAIRSQLPQEASIRGGSLPEGQLNKGGGAFECPTGMLPLDPPSNGAANGASGLLLSGAGGLVSYTCNRASARVTCSEEPRWRCAECTIGDHPGSPRKLALRPCGGYCYALCEADEAIVLCALGSDGSLERVHTLPLATANRTKATAARAPGSALCVTADGKYVYAALGSTGELVTMRVVDERGGLEKMEALDIGTGEACVPSDLVLAGDSQQVLIMADSCAHRLTAFKRNAETGRLSKLSSVYCPAPKCMLPLRWPPQAN